MSNITLSKTKPQVDTQDAAAVVTVNPAPVAGQTLKFGLTVIDDLGNVSSQATVVVAVQALPTVKLVGPAAVSAGSTITLKAAASPAGHINTYRWQLLSS